MANSYRPLPALPDPDFISRDAGTIVQEMIQLYEATSGKTLYPSQPERLQVDQIAYRELLLRQGIQDAAKQCLVRFARYPVLDYLGEYMGVQRLPPAPAATTLRFRLATPQDAPFLVAKGYQVRSRDGRSIFATLADLVIPAGAQEADVKAQADADGTAGNDYAPGDIQTPLMPLAALESVSNLTASTGGFLGEDDEGLRVRIMEAPERFSVAGNAGAYRWHALSVHPSIVDAAVVTPVPGTVAIHVLTRTGLPSVELLDQVAAVVASDKVRPLCDTVHVLPAVRVPWRLAAVLTVRTGADASQVLASAAAAAETFKRSRRERLGLDLVPSQIISTLMVDGMYSVEITEPAARILGAAEWGDCEGITLALGGVAGD